MRREDAERLDQLLHPDGRRPEQPIPDFQARYVRTFHDDAGHVTHTVDDRGITTYVGGEAVFTPHTPARPPFRFVTHVSEEWLRLHNVQTTLLYEDDATESDDPTPTLRPYQRPDGTEVLIPRRRLNPMRGFVVEFVRYWLNMLRAAKKAGTLPEQFHLPLLIAEVVQNQDLLFVPNPNLTFAFCEEQDGWVCWYTVFSDITAQELLHCIKGTCTKLYTCTGAPKAFSGFAKQRLMHLGYVVRERYGSLDFYGLPPR